METKWIAYLGDQVERVEVIGQQRDEVWREHPRKYVRFSDGSIEDLAEDDELFDTEADALRAAIKYTERWVKRKYDEASECQRKYGELRARLEALTGESQ